MNIAKDHSLSAITMDLANTLFMTRQRRKKVLLIEDNLLDAELTKEELDRWGCDVVKAQTGSDAIRFAEEAEIENAQFDISIIDLSLPDMSGLEVATFLKLNYTGIVIIMCSGSAAETGIVFDALRHGFIIVPKPFNLVQLKTFAQSLHA